MRMPFVQLTLSLALVAALGLSGCDTLSTRTAAPATPVDQITIIKSPNDDRQYAALVLPNQLQVVLVSDPTLENSAASLAVGVGSAQDPESHQGLAHYLEHMLFLGTEKYPEPDGFMKYTQENGGMTNAFTSFDKTNYMFQINAAKYDDALDRFSDYFKSPTFDPHFSDKERNAVNNEWSMQKAQDAWNVFALDGITGNPQNPQAKFNIGNLETLADHGDNKLQDQLKGFYDRYYSANIMRLTLVGKQSLPELKALAEKYFSSIPNKNIVRPEINTPGLTKAQYGKSIHYKPIKDMKVVLVDFPVSSMKKQWRLKPAEFVNNLVTSEETGTLGEQLRAKGLVKGVSAYVNDDAYGPDGYLRVQAELTDLGIDHQDEIVAAIFSYIELIKRDGMQAAYYDELKAMRAKDFINASKPNPLNQAVEITSLQFDLPVEHLLDADYIYDKYDPKVIGRLLKEIDKKRARVWYISAKETVSEPIPYFEGKYLARDITASEYKHWDELAKAYSFNLPPLNDLFSSEQAAIVENSYLKPHQVVSKPGVEAYLVHPEFYREDKGQISLQINTHLAERDAQSNVAAVLVNEIFSKQITSLVDRAGRASLGIQSTLIGNGSQGFVLSGYTSKHAQLLKTLLNDFVHLQISEKDFAEALDSYQQSLINSKKGHVYRQLFANLARLTQAQQWTADELMAASKTLSKADVENYHQALLQNPLLRLFVAGNYSEQQVSEFAAEASNAIPSKLEPKMRALEKKIPPAPHQWLEFAEDTELADSGLLQAFFSAQASIDERAQLEVLNALMGNAFFMQLRTHEQLGYAVFTKTYSAKVAGIFFLVQSSSADPATIKARMDKFRKEYYASLNALTDAEVEQTKQATIANLLEQPTDFYQEAGLYASEFWKAKYKFNKRERMVAALKKVTKQDLISIYQTLLLDEKKSQGILLQMRGANHQNKAFASPK